MVTEEQEAVSLMMCAPIVPVDGEMKYGSATVSFVVTAYRMTCLPCVRPVTAILPLPDVVAVNCLCFIQAPGRDTECYRGIKPMADGHPKPRIGSDDVTASITSPLVWAISDTPNLSCMFAQMHTFRSLVGR